MMWLKYLVMMALLGSSGGFGMPPVPIGPNQPKRTNEKLVVLLQEQRNTQDTAVVRTLQTELVVQNEKWLTACVRKNMPTSSRVVNVNPDTHDELYSVAVIGMLRSVPRFNATRGTKFLTFSTYWIRSEIFTYIHENRMVRVPVYLRRMDFKLTPFIVFCDMDMFAWDAVDRLDTYSRGTGLNYTRSSLVNYVQSKRVRVVGESAMGLPVCSGGHLPVYAADIRDALMQMDEGDRQYIEWRYMDASGKTISYRAIAARIGSSREWVRKKTVQALRKMRTILSRDPVF
jgi:DNA-directed RNA polymerase specialized sigma subunit